MTYTLGEAAKATGKSKPTISRAIKKGTISATKNDKNEYQIDPAELHRVFPMLQPASNDTGTVKQSETPSEDKVLQKEIEMLREMVDGLKADRDSWKEQAQRVTAMIEDKTKERKWFWQK